MEHDLLVLTILGLAQVTVLSPLIVVSARWQGLNGELSSEMRVFTGIVVRCSNVDKCEILGER